ncbi:MAG TPA: hypothetical protein PKK26_09555 [Candidatus Wallbacteria bacterium]|nr:hypothetical protein [Candidatus Wallbacteria bacterium]
MPNLQTEKLVKIIMLTLLLFLQSRCLSSAAINSEDAEKHLKNFETLFLKNDNKKAMDEFDKFAGTLSDESKVPLIRYYKDIGMVYSVFMNYVSSFRSTEIAFNLKENGKIKNNLFALFFKKYSSLLTNQLALIKTKEKSPELISYLEELNKSEESEKNFTGADYADISSEFEVAMKDVALIRFISSRPLFLFMLYKNVKEAGNDFQASFLKSVISKNVSPDILALSGFPEFAGAESGIKKDGWAIFDASLMSSFNHRESKISAADIMKALKGKTLKKADPSKAAAVKVVFSKHCFYFDIAGQAVTKLSNDAPDSTIIQLQNGRKIEMKPRKFDGVFSETAFLKNCKKIKYNNIDFYCCPETANKTFLLNTGNDFVEIVFTNFVSDVEAQAVLNSFKPL